MTKEIKKVKEAERIVTEADRKEATLQNFMNDMRMLGNQVNDSSLDKPSFLYGDLSITNYLLWLMLSEMMTLNDKLDDGSTEEETMEEAE